MLNQFNVDKADAAIKKVSQAWNDMIFAAAVAATSRTNSPAERMSANAIVDALNEGGRMLPLSKALHDLFDVQAGVDEY